MGLGRIVGLLTLSSVLAAPVLAAENGEVNAGVLYEYRDVSDADSISGPPDFKCAVFEYGGYAKVRFPKAVKKSFTVKTYGRAPEGDGIIPSTGLIVFEAYARAGPDDEWTPLGHYAAEHKRDWVSWSKVELKGLDEATEAMIVFRNESMSLRTPRSPRLLLGVDAVYKEKSE